MGDPTSTWTKLYESTADSVSMAQLSDEHPRAFCLWTFMLAKARVWGRFPGDLREFRHQVVGLCSYWSPARLEAALKVLENPPFEMVYRYEVDGVSVISNRNHFKYNAERNWSRIGSNQYPHPPGWVPPQSLITYFQNVHGGKVIRKQRRGDKSVEIAVLLEDELDRLQISIKTLVELVPDYSWTSPRLLPDKAPAKPTQKETLET